MDATISEVVVHVASYHTDRRQDFNENNLGAGLIVRERGSRFFLGAGAYRNSIRRTSVYAGIGYDLIEAGPFYARIEAIAVTGYQVPVAPAVMPEIGITWRGIGVAVHYIPHVKADGLDVAETFAFSLTKRF